MKWYHWTEKEPEDYEWILTYESTTLPITERHHQPYWVGLQLYRRYEGAYQWMLDHPDKRPGWTHWISTNDLSLPIKENENV